MQLELSFVSEPKPEYGEVFIKGPRRSRIFSYQKPGIPRLVIEGRYLKELGIEIGKSVQIEYYSNRIVINF